MLLPRDRAGRNGWPGLPGWPDTGTAATSPAEQINARPRVPKSYDHMILYMIDFI